MNIKIWSGFLVTCLCLTIASPVLSADCTALKKAFKQERNLKQRRILIADAVSQCPDDPDINYKYGLSLERFREYEKALGHYQKAVIINPQMAKGHAGMGDVYIYLGLLDEAIAAYEKAIRNESGNKRYDGRYARLVIKRKALRGEVLTVSDFIKVMDNRRKISTNMSLFLLGPALQYHIAFVENSATLQDKGISQLMAIGKAMHNESLQRARFEISAHVSTALSSLTALEDSKVRAKMIKDHLVTNYQIDPKRLEVTWYGDEQPLVTGKIEGVSAVNERVEFKRIKE